LIEKQDQNKVFFRSLKVIEEKYTEAKKAFDLNKSQLSQIEHRVLNSSETKKERI
jgi:hypothetical protein